MRSRTSRLIKAVLLCMLLTACSMHGDPIDSLFERIHQANKAFSEESEVPSGQSSQNTADEPLRGVWISYLELSKLAGSAEGVFHAQAAAMMQRVKEAGGNAVFVQVRPFGDAIYPSSVYPWSKTVSGSAGSGLSYDPLAVLLEQAHAQGLSFHAWINPYRLMNGTDFSKVDNTFRTAAWYNGNSRSAYMYEVNGIWWLKPSNSEAQALIVDGVRELLSKYALDGIHLDDYFYAVSPESLGETTASAKENNTRLIKTLYDLTKELKPNALFGVSPAGGFRKDSTLPVSDTGALSTDLALWCREAGYLDYVMPQIYWDETHEIQPFTMTLEKWRAFVTEPSVRLYVGLASYKFDAATIEKQEQAALEKADGFCLYRYDYI